MNRDKKIDAALSLFDGINKSWNISGDVTFDNSRIERIINEIIKSKLIKLDDDIINTIKIKVKSLYAVHQDDGISILADYEHSDDWYEKSALGEHFFWDRYKNHLVMSKRFSPKVIEQLENNTLNNLMSYLGNPKSNEGFSRKGLVIGDVQSGKTSNYIGLICKAVDAGYKVIFLLSGTTEILRQQTQKRVEEGFIGYDTANAIDVGVKRGDIVPRAFTTRNEDFVKNITNTTSLEFEKGSAPIIFIIKKNVPVLKKVFNALKINLKGTESKIKSPMLMVDDEADNASINTNDKDNNPTRTNENIRKILKLFEKSNYVGFTATPFANVFIDPDTDDEMLEDDLFPRDFIYALSSPSNYNGAKRMFMERGKDNDRNMIEYIDINDKTIQELYDIFPLIHKKDWKGDRLHDSVYESIDRFLITNAIRDLKDENTNTHRSMMINMSRFKAVQFLITDLIREYVNDTKNDIKQSMHLSKKEYIENKSVSKLKRLFDKNYECLGISWDSVFSKLYNSIKDIAIITVNSDKDAVKLNYEKHIDGYRVIAIGGMALSRGLTLEGLMISYFYRNSATFDVLMQMGRWFGYRDAYKELCKVYMLQSSASYYEEIVESVEELMRDMREMHDKKQKPQEYGIRVRNDFYNNLKITAANKMRSTKSKIIRANFWGEMFYTQFLNYGEDNSHNIEQTQKFLNKNLNKLDKSVSHIYLRNVSNEDAIKFFSNLKINENLNSNFDISQVISFMKRITLNFDVLVMSGAAQEEVNFGGSKIKPQYRKYTLVKGVDYIRINKGRLGGNNDTSHGLDSKTIKDIEIEYPGGKNEKNYLIEGRNPLLIVYLIKPNNKLSNNSVDLPNDGILTKDQSSKLAEEKFENELLSRNCKYLIGYQIGFPKHENSACITHKYVINTHADYFKNHLDIFPNEEEE